MIGKITPEHYKELTNKVDPKYGPGLALYNELHIASLTIGARTPLAKRFRTHLRTANAKLLPFDKALPSYNEYSAVMDEYFASVRQGPRHTDPASQAEGNGELDFDELMFEEVAPAARFVPPPKPIDPTNSDVLEFFTGLGTTVNAHADQLDELETKVSRLAAKQQEMLNPKPTTWAQRLFGRRR